MVYTLSTAINVFFLEKNEIRSELAETRNFYRTLLNRAVYAIRNIIMTLPRVVCVCIVRGE